MDVNGLLQTNKITKEDYDAFVLFEQSEIGRAYLNRMVEATFMDEPHPQFAKPLVFVYMDGRRSIFRAIKRTIDEIYKLLREEPHDNSTGNERE